MRIVGYKNNISDRVNEKVLGKMGIYRFLDGARKGINQGKARN